MKVLLLSNMYPSQTHLFYGIFVKNFSESMEAQGATIDKVVIEGRGASRSEKIKKYIMYYASSLKKLASNKYDVIYVHSASHALVPVAILRLLIKKPIIINIHGSDVTPHNFTGKLIHTINKNAIANCSLAIIPSHAFEKQISSHVKLPATFISPSGGVNRSVFFPRPYTKVNPRLITIGFVSRIDEDKGWDTFIEALSELKQKKPDLSIKAIIVGTGSQVKDMLRMISDMNLESIFQYIPQLAQPELPTIYHSLDVFVFPTRRLGESLGLVGLEAMSCGVPIIASKIGGIQDYVIDGENGYSCEPGNAQDFFEKISTFLSLSPEQKNHLAKGAIATAEEYDSIACAKNLYEQIEITHRAYP